MNRRIVAMAMAMAMAGMAVTAFAAAPAEHHILASSAALKWVPAPAVFPAGSKIAVVDGDLAASGPLTVRMMMPPGYKMAPHWHPTDEHITVLSGSLSIGMGDTPDAAHSVALKAGGYAVAGATMHHYASTQTGTVIQVDMMGPFAITYVNPADDPSHPPAKK